MFNAALCFILIFGKFLQVVFFGPLLPNEREVLFRSSPPRKLGLIAPPRTREGASRNTFSSKLSSFWWSSSQRCAPESLRSGRFGSRSSASSMALLGLRGIAFRMYARFLPAVIFRFFNGLVDRCPHAQRTAFAPCQDDLLHLRHLVPKPPVVWPLHPIVLGEGRGHFVAPLAHFRGTLSIIIVPLVLRMVY